MSNEQQVVENNEITDEDLFAQFIEGGPLEEQEEPEATESEEDSEPEQEEPEGEGGEAEASDEGEEEETPDEEEPDEESEEDESDAEEGGEGPEQDTAQDDEKPRSEQEQANLVAKLQHELAAANGRNAPLQRELEKLRRELSKVQSQKPQQPAPHDSPNSSKEDLAKWEAHRKDFPEEAEAVERFFSAKMGEQRQEIQKLKQVVEQLSSKAEVIERLEQQQTSDRDAQEVGLLTKPVEEGGFGHTDAPEIFADREFHEWAQNGPGKVPELYASHDAADYDLLLTKYKAYRNAISPPPPPQEEEPETSKVAEKRERALKESAAPTSTPTPSRPDGGGAELSDEEYFARLMDKAYKR